MNKRAQYLIQVLEQIGAPLVSSVMEAADGQDIQSHARYVAELLTTSVKFSIQIGEMADLSKGQDDSVRLALSAISSGLLADVYKRKKAAPGEGELTKLHSALQSVMSFADNFTPDGAHAERLQALDVGSVMADPAQMQVQYIYAFVSVIDAIADFAFGQDEKKLLMDVSVRITAEASNMRKSLLPTLSELEAKQVDLVILRALLEIYVACHRAEKARLSDGGEGGIDAVWSAYEVRVAMIDALSRSLVLANVDGVAVDPSPSVSAQSPAPDQVDPVPSAAELQGDAGADADGSGEDSAGGASPMGTFVSKLKDEPHSKEPVEDEAPPPAQNDDSAGQGGGNPMAMFSKTPQAESKPSSDGDDVADDGGGDDAAGDGGNPMAFFSKKDD